MAILPRWKRLRSRNWRKPFSWFDWYQLTQPKVLFRYAPMGRNYTGAMTFARADASTYVDSTGTVQAVAANVLRNQHYINGVGPYTLLEGSRANDLNNNRDLTAAGWTATNVTVARSTGADGIASAGSRLTATAGNATVIRTAALVHASQDRAGSFWVKRVTGTGNIQITLDNGATWTTITVTSSFMQVSKTQTLANSQFGIRIVTNGDAVDVDYTQNESGAFASSAIPTAGAAVTRAADALFFQLLAVPQAMTMFVDALDLGTVDTATIASVGYGWPLFNMRYVNGNTIRSQYQDAVPSTRLADVAYTYSTGTPTRIESISTLSSAGVVNGALSVNGGAITTGGDSAALALAGSWSYASISIGCDAISGASRNYTFLAVRKVIVAAGVQSLNTMRNL